MTNQDFILIHGWASDETIWLETREYLQKKHRVFALNLPHSINLDTYWQAVLQLMKNQDLKQVILMGWSMGALVALQVAKRFPENIKGLVLVSGTSKFVSETPRKDSRQDYPGGIPAVLVYRMEKRLAKNRLQTFQDFYRLMFSPQERAKGLDLEIMEKYLLQGRRWSTEEALAGLKFLLECDTRADLEAITCPVLLIHGEDDEICPLAGAAFITTKLKGQMVVFPGSGHMPFLTNSNDFYKCLMEWVDEQWQ
ncbi:MAG: alpha/beta fold hydrolase [Bacillota bacterium]